MKALTIFLAIVFGLCSFGSASLALADAAVWKVANASGQHMYVVGSVHVLRPADYPLPDAFDRAWQQSQVAVFETDMAALQQPRFQQQLLTRFANPPGITAQSLLSAENWRDLTAFAADIGLSLDVMQRYHPAFIVLTAMQLDWQKNGLLAAYGVDNFYYEKALRQGRPVVALEAPEQQLDYLVSLMAADANDFTAASLADFGRTPHIMLKLISLWRAGDMPALFAQGAASMLPFPQIYQALIVRRNRRWMTQLQQLIATEPVEFVLVGALHLAGPDSILLQLKQAGYRVTKLR